MDALAGHRHRERLGLQARAAARGARPQRHELLDVVAHGLRHRARVLAPQLRDHALEPAPAAALAAPPQVHALAPLGALQQQLALALGQAAPRPVEVDLVLLGDRSHQQVVVVRRPVGPGQHRALGQAALRVDDQLGVDLEREAEAGALRAGAVGRVEREGPRRELGHHGAVDRAGEALGVDPRARLGVGVARGLLDPHLLPHRRPGRGGEGRSSTAGGHGRTGAQGLDLIARPSSGGPRSTSSRWPTTPRRPWRARTSRSRWR